MAERTERQGRGPRSGKGAPWPGATGFALAVLLLVYGVRGAGGEAPPRTGAAALKGYEETIPGTTVTLEMVPVPPGQFQFADPVKNGARTKVAIKPIWIGKTEVTWDAYDIYAFRLDLPEDQRSANVEAETRPSKPYGAPDEGFGHHGYAALRPAYNAAQQYCRWLSKKTGKKYRLPTEAEWEYACRAGPAAAPMSPSELEKHAWFWDNAEDQTHPVGTKAANAWGIHDMLGNVWEWCSASDGKGVVRGGSYRDKAPAVHCGARAEYSPDWQLRDSQRPKSRWWLSDAPFVGLRIVRDP